jgi:alpha-tubulin suppressor-like RCC1 family protein
MTYPTNIGLMLAAVSIGTAALTGCGASADAGEDSHTLSSTGGLAPVGSTGSATGGLSSMGGAQSSSSVPVSGTSSAPGDSNSTGGTQSSSNDSTHTAAGGTAASLGGAETSTTAASAGGGGNTGGTASVGGSATLGSGGTLVAGGSSSSGTLSAPGGSTSPGGSSTSSTQPLATGGVGDSGGTIGVGGSTAIDRAVSISGTYDHTCAALDNGGVRCWGSNDASQLGNGTTTPINAGSLPVAVKDIAAATRVVTGQQHSCALRSDGTVACWGAWVGSSITPSVDTGFRSPQDISAGGADTCALFNDGRVFCLGANDYGQLGNGGNFYLDTAVEVNGLSNATAMAVGLRHVCATSVRYNVSGSPSTAVWCWGSDDDSQIPTSDGEIYYEPQEFNGPMGKTVAMSAGFNHSCLLMEEGSVICFGLNTSGQLGLGLEDTSRRSHFPKPPVYVLNLGSNHVVSVSAGDSFTCALISDGTIQCWGASSHCQLGNGSTQRGGIESAVVVSGITNATAVTTGRQHACALLNNGSVKCWGNNYLMQLGHNTTDCGVVTVDGF